jgi:ketosteroid isomerase-like protein
MQNQKANIAILTVAALLAANTVRAGVQEDQKSEQEIRAALAAWVVANNNKDPAANSIWAPNTVGWTPSIPEFGYGAAFALAGIPPSKDGGYPTFELRIDSVDVSGPLAAVHDVWTETLHFNGSSVTVKRIIHGSEMWRLQPDGKWRIARWVSAPEKWEKVS